MTTVYQALHLQAPTGSALWKERAQFIFLPATVVIIAGLFAAIIYSTYNVRPMPVIEQVKVFSSVEKKTTDVSFPYSKNGAPQEILNFTIQVSFKPGESTVFSAIPDDCIDSFDVNKKPVSMEGDALKHRCDWQHGFTINLKPYLVSGINDIHIQVINHLGPMGLKFEPVSD